MNANSSFFSTLSLSLSFAVLQWDLINRMKSIALTLEEAKQRTKSKEQAKSIQTVSLLMLKSEHHGVASNLSNLNHNVSTSVT
jgi:hypothetical protein